MRDNLLIATLTEQNQVFRACELGIEREILGQIKSTIVSPQITVITGLRRVGKSTLLAQIAAKYLNNDYYFINFEDERLLNFSVTDFDLLHETLISLFGEKKVFLFDEIQNVSEWERFVRRLHDQGYKFIITGSNAALLSQELGTRLTGRSTRVELFPFSFREFLQYKQVQIPNLASLSAKQKGVLRQYFDEYVLFGGIPDALKYPELALHKTLYDDVLYRNIATRYKLENVKNLQELAFYLLSNVSNLLSFNKLKDLLKLGSVNTVSSYIEYLENSWLFFVVNKFAYSVKEQQIAAKKIYGIDSGLIKSIGFSFSENRGKLLENIAFLHLRRQQKNIYYFKTAQDHEIDFVVPELGLYVQVAQQFSIPETREREIRPFFELVKDKNPQSLLIITEAEKEELLVGDKSVLVIPMYEWLLQ
ncbi:MAG: ATP-binding protein [bacterium]|nr:ATP-binding protein [bacterium]